MEFALIEGEFDPEKVGYDFSEIIRESENSDMLPLSLENIGNSQLTSIAVIGQVVVASSAVKENVIVVDKRNPDYWQQYQFSLLGGCITTDPYKRRGLSTALITQLIQKTAIDHPELKGMTGFFNLKSGQLAKHLGFSEQCFWLWGQREINQAGRTRHSLIFPGNAQ